MALVIADDRVLCDASAKSLEKLLKTLAFAKEYLHKVDSPTFRA
jgi:hypothetical protein